MQISIVVPHLNQPEHLGRCLESINDAGSEAGNVEIIVVDNGSTVMPEDICARHGNVRLTSEPIAGPGPARNTGVSIASADLLAFIDADCRADPSWLDVILREFEDRTVDVIGGAVRVGYANGLRPIRHEPYEAIYSYRNDEHIAQGFSGTGNLAMRRTVFDHVGPFAGIETAEDRDWGYRAGDLGYTIRYVEDMVVSHPARPTFEDLVAKWDRHIAHDFAEVQGLKGVGKWSLRTAAVAASPLAEILTVSRSPLISGGRQRLLALAYLVRIRWRRAWRMTTIMLAGDKRRDAEVWNRG